MKSRIIALFIVVAAFFVVTSDSLAMADRKQASAISSAKIKLRIGYIPIMDCAQLYVASHLGYFSEVGLDVELVPLAGGAAIIQALSTDAIDIGFANLATIVFYEQMAPRLNRLAGGTRMDNKHSEAGLVVLADSGIERLSDLRGKTIAVNSRRNIVDLAILRAIKNNGLFANDIKLVELPFKDMETALRSKRIDVAPLPEPLLSIALKMGGVRDLGDHFSIAFGEIYSTGYFAMPKSTKVAATTLQSYNNAISKATKDLQERPEKTFEAISTFMKLPVETVMSAGKPEFVNEIPESAFLQMKTWLEAEGLIDKK